MSFYSIFFIDFYSLTDLKADKGLELKIQNTDCVLQGTKDGCNYKFPKKSGSCPFTQTLAQLTPSVDIGILTKNFIVTDKLNVEEMAFDKCTGENLLRFKLKSKESLQIIAQYITLAANSVVKIGWKHTDDELKLSKLKIEMDGVTSVGELVTYISVKTRIK